MSFKGKLKEREKLILLLFLGLVFSFIVVAYVSTSQTDQEIERHILVRK